MYSATEVIIRIFWVNEAQELQCFFFVVLLYGNELSDEMKMLCCGNVLQNTHTNKQTKPNKQTDMQLFFFKSDGTSRLLMNLFFNPQSAGYVHSVLQGNTEQLLLFFPPTTNTQLYRTSDSVVAKHDVRLEHRNGLLKCSDPLSLRFQKKTLQHTPLLISPLCAFHHF